MQKNKSNQFKFRAFLGIYLAISLVIMTISGIILYISPPGRIAHWSYWAIVGFTKTEWQNIHTTFTFIFIVAGGIHIFYNWKPLMNYLSRKSKGTSKIRKEMIFAVSITISIFVGTYIELFPFSTVIDLGEEITDSWSDENNEPPIPHAEELTIVEYAELQKISVTEFQELLEKAGYSARDTLSTMQQVADKYGVTPNEVSKVIQSDLAISTNINSVYKAGSGYGRKLLSEILTENNLNWETSIEKLLSNGIKVEKDDKLKNIADDNNILPIDIIKTLDL